MAYVDTGGSGQTGGVSAVDAQRVLRKMRRRKRKNRRPARAPGDRKPGYGEAPGYTLGDKPPGREF